MNDCPHDQCPSWWGCAKRGCYEQAKRNYASGDGRTPPSTTRSEERQNAEAYFGGVWFNSRRY